jgi:hypothetical protein
MDVLQSSCLADCARTSALHFRISGQRARTAESRPPGSAHLGTLQAIAGPSHALHLPKGSAHLHARGEEQQHHAGAARRRAAEGEVLKSVLEKKPQCRTAASLTRLSSGFDNLYCRNSANFTRSSRSRGRERRDSARVDTPEIGYRQRQCGKLPSAEPSKTVFARGRKPDHFGSQFQIAASDSLGMRRLDSSVLVNAVQLFRCIDHIDFHDAC